MHFWYGSQTCAKVQKSVQKSVEILHIFCKNRRNFTFSGFCAKRSYSLKNHFFAKIVEKPLGKTRVPPPPPGAPQRKMFFPEKTRFSEFWSGRPDPLVIALLLMHEKKFRTGSGAPRADFIFPENFFFFREKKQCFIFFIAFCLKCSKE